MKRLSVIENVKSDIELSKRRKEALSYLVWSMSLGLGLMIIIVVTIIYQELKNEIVLNFLIAISANFISFAFVFFWIEINYRNKIQELDNSINELKKSIDKKS